MLKIFSRAPSFLPSKPQVRYTAVRPRLSVVPKSKFESTMDRVGIWLSGLCMIHCVATPIVLLALPMMTFAKSELPHLILAGLLPLVTVAAFIPGFRRHRDAVVLELGVFGLVFIVFAALDPFHILNEMTEGLVTSCGSLMLIGAHLRNRKHHHCEDPNHGH